MIIPLKGCYVIWVLPHLMRNPSLMSKPLQLHIPKPCHEDWSGMHPSEKGRHCMTCQKTVVDFTAMSDAEILQYMRQAGSQVCGRLTTGQMNRDLMPSPAQRNGGKGWSWLIAGALMTADGAPPPHISMKDNVTTGEITATPDTVPVADTTAIISEDEFLVGRLTTTVEHEPEPMYDPVETPLDSLVKGTVSMVAPDSIAMPAPEIPVADTMDAVPLNMRIKQFITDTLTMLRIIPKTELKVYPNPIRRGTSFHIAWPSEPGTYKVSLISAAGVSIRTRVVEVGSSAQVDTWEMPGGVAAGVYIIQAVCPERAVTRTQKVIVE